MPRQTANNERVLKKTIITTALIFVVLVAGTQPGEQRTELCDAQYAESVQARLAAFWKQVAMKGAMAPVCATL